MDIPKIYVERPDVLPNAEYVLVSYAHANSSKVYPDLNLLYDEGVNFWYDKELTGGDIWYKIVEERLIDPKCCGIVFFFDVNCLVRSDELNNETISNDEMTGRDAVEREIEIFERVKIGKPNMRALCVLNSEDKSVYSIVRQAFVKCKDLSDARLKEVLPEKRIKTVIDSFNKDKLYILRNDDYIKQIADTIRKWSPYAITDSKSALEEFQNSFGGAKGQNGIKEVKLGLYPQKCTGKTTESVNSIFETGDGVKYLLKNKNRYDFAPIEWKLLDTDGKEALLVSKYVLDICVGTKDSINGWLSRFKKEAFSEEELDMICDVDLMSVDIVEHYGAKLPKLEATELVGQQVDMAWLANCNGPHRKTYCGVWNDKADIDYEFIDSIAGILPMIKIKFNK